jgi:hypothetical protein
MTGIANPTCPQCGFRIFNRRYPRCEGCGANLPDSLIYSDAEIAAMQAQERQAALERRRKTAKAVSASAETDIADITLSIIDIAGGFGGGTGGGSDGGGSDGGGGD